MLALFSDSREPSVTIWLGWYTDHYVKNGDRARVMAKMLVALTGCFVVIAALVPSGLQHEYCARLILGTRRILFIRPLFDVGWLSEPGYRRPRGRRHLHRNDRRHRIYRCGRGDVGDRCSFESNRMGGSFLAFGWMFGACGAIHPRDEPGLSPGSPTKSCCWIRCGWVDQILC